MTLPVTSDSRSTYGQLMDKLESDQAELDAMLASVPNGVEHNTNILADYDELQMHDTALREFFRSQIIAAKKAEQEYLCARISEITLRFQQY